MIGSLMYLTASRHDIQFSTCLCARYQANLKESHLIAAKIFFKYLKGTSNLGLWYPKGSDFDLKAYSDSDYAGCNLDRKNTLGGAVLKSSRLKVSWLTMIFDEILEDIHVTWAHLEKKRIRLQLYTKLDEEDAHSD
ncbi:hypothetical protein Tco_0103536 [Tanacetum coccineum]